MWGGWQSKGVYLEAGEEKKRWAELEGDRHGKEESIRDRRSQASINY